MSSSLRCIKCNVHVVDKPIHRTTEVGSKDPEWMCVDCIREYHDISLLDDDTLDIMKVITNNNKYERK